MNKPRCVFDANTLISALLFAQSVPAQAFFAALRYGVVLLSLPLLSELQRVLARPKFDRYILPEERERFLAHLALETARVDITTEIAACRDPKDNQILELAVSGAADFIVTGDADLLVLHPFRNIAIVNAADFLTALPPAT